MAMVLSFLPGCAPRTIYNEKYVSDEIGERSGFHMPDASSDSISFPSGIRLDDGLSEEEAVAIALWNNHQFQADLSDLGFARADLIEAGMLPNPAFSLLFPLGPKQLEFTLSYAIDILWQRPSRVAAAKLNAEKVAENLVSHGLALVRNVYVSFADLHMAREKLRIMDDEAALDGEIAQIASVRMQAGDISELEETAFHLAASRTREACISARRDMEIRKIRFLTLLGLISEHADVQINPGPVSLSGMPDPELLIKTGLACRPDLRAAELEIEIAGERLGWERSKIFNLTAMLDANAQGTSGFEMGPGASLEIPIFYFNQGGTARARTEIQRASDHYLAVQQSIRAEILETFQGYKAARQSYEFLLDEVMPQAEQAVQNGEEAYAAGEISYLEFLEFRRQLLQTRLRTVEAEAEVRKNAASIYYTIGGNVIPF
jgi:cobalt-zinc-cadmium efflux system outer membrane protein